MSLPPQYLSQLEQQHNLPNGLLMAVMNKESSGNPNAVSPKGAQGLFQFMPDTAKAYGIDPLNPQQAAQGAAKMYSDLLGQYQGNLPMALAGYNWGSGNLAKYGMEKAPAETRDYINTIMGQVQPQQVAQADNIATDAQVSNLLEIEMPDGTIIENVPAGTPPAEIEAAWKAMTQQNAPEEKGVGGKIADAASDFGKDIPRQLGLTARYTAEGLAGLADPINMAINAVGEPLGMSPLQLPSQMASKAMTALGAPQPANALERVVGDASRALSGAGGSISGAANLAKYAPSVAPLAENAALQAKAALGGSASAGATREAGGGTLAQVAAGLAGGGLATMRAIPKKQTYTAEEVKSMAGDAYKQADMSGGKLKGWFTNRFLDDIEKLKPQTEAGKILAGDDAFSQLVNRIGGLKNKPLSLREAQEIDEYLGDAAESFVNAQGKLTKQGKKILDIQSTFRNSIEDASDDLLIRGKEGFDAWKKGQKLWSKSLKMADVERIINRAENYDNPATAIRSGFRTLLNNPKKLRGFTEDEIGAMKKAAKSGVVDEVLRFAGSRLTPIIGMGSGNVASVLGVPAAAAAREGGALLQYNRAANVLNKMAGTKPRDATPALRAGLLGTMHSF